MYGPFLFFFKFLQVITDQRIPDPVSCRWVGLLETPPRWHATIICRFFHSEENSKCRNIQYMQIAALVCYWKRKSYLFYTAGEGQVLARKWHCMSVLYDMFRYNILNSWFYLKIYVKITLCSYVIISPYKAEKKNILVSGFDQIFYFRDGRSG